MVIGGFAAELAHEIRNPLSSILGLVDVLHERLPPGDEGHRHLDVLSRASQRIEYPPCPPLRGLHDGQKDEIRLFDIL